MICSLFSIHNELLSSHTTATKVRRKKKKSNSSFFQLLPFFFLNHLFVLWYHLFTMLFVGHKVILTFSFVFNMFYMLQNMVFFFFSFFLTFSLVDNLFSPCRVGKFFLYINIELINKQPRENKCLTLSYCKKKKKKIKMLLCLYTVYLLAKGLICRKFCGKFKTMVFISSIFLIVFSGHNNVVRTIVHSPTGPAFLTCSDDFRARFWYRKANSD